LTKLTTAENERTASCPAEGAHASGETAALLGRAEEEQRALGYFHTFREILQQPATWKRTAEEMAGLCDELLKMLAGAKLLILTGSGSSEYAGECLRLTLQNALSIPVQTIAAGDLLTHGGKAIGPERPALMVSFARSGDSPESTAALSGILGTEPAIRHLVVTCNANGKLAKAYHDDARVRVVVLAEETNDRSLVMTSSFTNMTLAASVLGMLQSPGHYLALANNLSRKAEELLRAQLETLSECARRDFNRVIFLASGPRLGAARESALKMLEMTAGRVFAVCETYLGLRHGPMSAIHPNTLVVCFLDSAVPARAYELDLIRELNRKQIGMAKLIFGEGLANDLARKGDVLLDANGLAELGDDHMPILDVLVGQLLAFFRCLKENLKPDCPSTDGVINRVVQEFTLHSVNLSDDTAL
jgi:tagatose-6-phosphate ketose/aldose isomerase